MATEISGRDDQGRKSARRTLLRRGLGAAPVLATLSSRSALGATSLCTKSMAMSGNLSRGTLSSCGVSPGCWKNKGSAEWWIAEGPKRIQEIFDAFIDAPNGTNGYKPQWRVSLSGNGYNVYKNIKNVSYSEFAGSFTQGLYGDVHAYCVLKGTDGNYKTTPDNVVEITGNGFLSQLISAALNAAFFRDSGSFGVSQLYPYSLYDVINLVNSNPSTKFHKS